MIVPRITTIGICEIAREVKRMMYWLFKHFVIGPWLKVLFRPWVEGQDNIPQSGGVILASNHLSFSDSFYLALYVKRPMAYLAKSDYFTGKGLKGYFTKLFMSSVGQVPIDRSGGRASEAAINTALKVLNGGNVLINTYEIQPPGKLRPRLMRVGMRIGKPLDFSRYEGLEDDRFVLRSVTDEVMYELMSLSGQEYVDMYATRAKELIANGELADAKSSLR
jgi:1-acyl-sn-glycerol-3-phosphate acyltransferase